MGRGDEMCCSGVGIFENDHSLNFGLNAHIFLPGTFYGGGGGDSIECKPHN